MDKDEFSDKSLMRRFRQGEDDAPTQLYLRYAERLQALATKQTSAELGRRLDPEDIVQTVFRTFFRRVAQGNYDVPDGEEIWKLVRRTNSGDANDLVIQEASGKDETALAVLRMVVDDVLTGLSESHRKMIELRIEGHEVVEISQAVGRSKRSVERVLQDFRRRMGELIHEADGS